jgi:hypothetical protein
MRMRNSERADVALELPNVKGDFKMRFLNSIDMSSGTSEIPLLGIKKESSIPNNTPSTRRNF